MDAREAVLHCMLCFSAAAAMVWFWLTSSYSGTLWVYVRGVAVGVVIAVPDWMFFCRSPFRWLQPLGFDRPKRPRSSSKKLVAEKATPLNLSSLQCWRTTCASMLGGSR